MDEMEEINLLYCTALYNTIQHGAEYKCRVCTVHYTAQHCTALYCTVLKMLTGKKIKAAQRLDIVLWSLVSVLNMWTVEWGVLPRNFGGTSLNWVGAFPSL